MVAEHVPLTQKEAEILKDVVKLVPLRKGIGDGKPKAKK
jgi:hypothetical protein